MMRVQRSTEVFYADQFGSLRIPAKSLDPELFFLIDKMQEGDISEPQTVLVGESKVARIIYYKKRMPPHRANLTDDYEKLKAATTQMKKVVKACRVFRGEDARSIPRTRPRF